MSYCKHTYTYSHFTLSQFFCNLSIHTDTNRYTQNTYRYMPYCAHTYSYAHFTLSQFSASASRPAAQWGGSDGRADSDNRTVTASALAASRADNFTAWKSQKELVRSAGLSAARPGQAVSRRKTVNATINPQQQNPSDVSILSDQEKAT